MGIAEACEIKKSVAVTALATLASVGTGEVKKSGKFVIPGLAMIKTRKKPATKAKKMEMFGKTVLVKAKPAKTVVKVGQEMNEIIYVMVVMCVMCCCLILCGCVLKQQRKNKKKHVTVMHNLRANPNIQTTDHVQSNQKDENAIIDIVKDIGLNRSGIKDTNGEISKTLTDTNHLYGTEQMIGTNGFIKEEEISEHEHSEDVYSPTSAGTNANKTAEGNDDSV